MLKERIAGAALLACALIVPAFEPHQALAAAPRASARPVAKRAPAPRATPFRIKYGPAPADEYFGRLGMSILGVRNKVKDLGLQADVHPDEDARVLSNALWVEDAMRAWARKYPYDKWLPRYAWSLEVMYERIPGEEAHKRAIHQLNYITAYFPQTIYGRVGRYKLVAGVPTPEPSAENAAPDELARLALLDGRVLPTTPPAPAPSPAATPESTPLESATPAAVPSAVATPERTLPAATTPLPSSSAVPVRSTSPRPR